jgi:competence protein ComEC
MLGSGLQTPSDPNRPTPGRPLLVPAIAAAVGIVVARFAPFSPWHWTVAAVAALVAVIALAVWPRGRPWLRGTARVVAVAVVALLLGAAWFSVRNQVGPRDISRLTADVPRLVTVEGVVTSSPREAPPPDNPLLIAGGENRRSTGLYLTASAVTVDGRREPADGHLRVTVAQGLDDARPDGLADDSAWPPRTGDRVTVTGLLNRPMVPLNPGQSDLRETWGLRGIRAALRTDFWAACRFQRGPWWSAYAWMGALRDRLRQDMPPPDTVAGRYVPALLLGDRTELLDRDEQQFIRSGLMHFLAVSGSHVVLFSALVVFVLRRALVGPRTRGLLLIVFLVGYTLATEAPPSVIRAGIFFLLLSLTWLLGRRRDLLNTLAASALIVLALCPSDLFNVGFQLSFVAVLGLIVVCPVVRDRLFGRHEWLRHAELSGWSRRGWQLRVATENFASTCLTAWAFAAPLTAWHFHMVAPVGVVASLVVAPLISLLMVLVALAAALALVPGLPGGLLAWPIDQASAALEATVRFFDAVPYGHTYLRSFEWPWVLLAAGLMLVWAHRRRLRVARWQLATAVAVAIGGYVWVGIPRGPHDEVRITTLAVGSGNTVLIQAPDGWAALVDCGSSLQAERTAELVTAPALWQLGVAQLNAVILTHADADHIKDLPPVLERIPADRILVSANFRTQGKSYDDRALAWLGDQGYEVGELSRGDTLETPDGVTIRVLWPPSDLPPTDESNDASVVIAVKFEGRTMLLTGDATPAALKTMAAHDDVRGQAVLLPHHGQESRQLTEFLRATGAGIGVMSVGAYRDGQRKHIMTWPPDLRVLRTFRDGAVTVHLGPDGTRVETFVDHR